MLKYLKQITFLHSLYIIIVCTLVGEMYRFNFGPEGGVIITDAIIPVFIAYWFSFKLLTQKKTWLTTFFKNQPKTFQYFLVFIVIALISLIRSFLFFDTKEVIIAAMYWVRFTSYGLLGFLTYHELKTKKEVFNLIWVLVVTTVLIAITGFVQMLIYPDLSPIVDQGWDPHQNRLVSTWLDPNFVGGLMSFTFSILLGITLYLKKSKLKTIMILLLLIIEFAMFFSFSRSTYLAFIVGVFIVTMLQSKKAFFIIFLIFTLQMSSSSYAVQRVLLMIFNLDSIFSQENPDATARFRVRSWLDTIELAKERPILGHGYNNLATLKSQRNLVHSGSNHSASGSDSSLLTILATSGILGFIPFFFLYLMSFLAAFNAWKDKSLDILYQGLNLGLMGGIGVLFIHSVFVNSLLYPPIMIFFFAVWGAATFSQGKTS